MEGKKFNKRKLLNLVIFLVLGAVLLAAVPRWLTALPGVKESATGKVAPSGELAFFHVRKLAAPEFQGRAPGSRGADYAARYIASQLRRSGCRPAGEAGTFFQSLRIPCFTLLKRGLRWKPVVREEEFLLSDNVLAAIGPAEGGSVPQTVIISAHYDHLGAYGPGYFPGANDNASGVAVLLEAARVLTAEEEALPFPVIFAAWTGEEEGMYGSRHFASRFSPERIKAVINLDSLGTGSPVSFLVWTKDRKNRLLPIVEEAAREVGVAVDVRVLSSSSGYNSDHWAFAEDGIPAVTILSPDWLEKNHTFEDIPERIVPSKLENGVRLVVKMVEKLAERER
ncbi:peptidase M28 [Thermacetogenium phaeum DSM 12270]|uniref:Peptidase M28 n=1 Tax=Thermacetogenium phaeum (strain ATCC BAA-254 / DSM 26808 / PB) TaxID=1089553 RepID=K4LTV7_THEPS|nr:M20/M25/M40 family metallo-hydrolase [Thermacetogenium phaeum]AFV11474.1 peptidase M28 [Thermacetogenium phaeum DSM 12270]